MTPTSRCLCSFHVKHTAIVGSTSSSGAPQIQHSVVTSLPMRGKYEPNTS